MLKTKYLYTLELMGGDHEEGSHVDGSYILYKKGDIFKTSVNLSEKFRGKFRIISRDLFLNAEDYFVPEEIIKPPRNSMVHRVSEKRLSILICTLRKRKKLLDRLLRNLEPQIVDSVEIVIEEDKGEMSTGEKRNLLLKKAQGDYIAFIDDDDLVSNNYVSKILWALMTNPDCCELTGLLIRDKENHEFHHSIEHSKWEKIDKRYLRCPNHLNTVKRELALRIGFPNLYAGEDINYSHRLRPLLKIEAKIEGPLYYYLKVREWAKL